jgi:TolB-like protein/Flp pilus assembly protein TadD
MLRAGVDRPWVKRIRSTGGQGRLPKACAAHDFACPPRDDTTGVHEYGRNGHSGVNQDSTQQAVVDSHVFVSYASQDAAVANAVVENLEQHGIKCWIAPRDVTPGSQYADEIVAAINDAKVLVLVLSEYAVASPHVGREIERAASKLRRIIVLRTDAAPLTRSFEYFLSESQWIDVAALGVPAALLKLTQAVRQRMAPSSWVSPGLGRDVRDPAARIHKPSYLTIKRIGAAAVFLVIAALVVGVMVRYWPSKQGGSPPPVAAAISDKSIAVLPFVDMSEKRDQEFFADGMAEEIIDLLVKVPGLKVISRTSSFQFKGRSEDLRAVGEQLGTHYVLEGSVRKAGDRLRVTAQLINSRDGTHLFSETYDRGFSDVLKMQDEIAIALVRALQIEVSSEGLDSRPTLRNPQAYTAYLQGLHAFDRNDQHGFEQAVSNFQQALDLDPSFAQAASALASSYFVLGQFGFMPPGEAFEKARLAAQRALALDPNLASGHANLAEVYRAYDWNWAAADREIQLARTLAPNDPDVLFISAVQAQSVGRWDDALKFINASLVLDPLNPPGHMVLNFVQLGRGRLEEAEAAIRRTVELNPTFTHGHYFLGVVLLARGEPQSALTEMEEDTQEPTRLGGSAMAYFALGRKAESDGALAQLLKRQANHPYFIAQVYAYRGETADALKWLDRAYAQRDASLALLKSQESFMRLEGDPRYKVFLRKMNLPDG